MSEAVVRQYGVGHLLKLAVDEFGSQHGRLLACLAVLCAVQAADHGGVPYRELFSGPGLTRLQSIRARHVALYLITAVCGVRACDAAPLFGVQVKAARKAVALVEERRDVDASLEACIAALEAQIADVQALCEAAS